MSVADPVASMVSTCFSTRRRLAAYSRRATSSVPSTFAGQIFLGRRPNRSYSKPIARVTSWSFVTLASRGSFIRSNAIQLGARLVKSDAMLSMSSPKVRGMLGARGAFPMAMRRRWVHHVADRDSILARAGLNDGAVETR
ncbi:MAG: hypothetical protein U0610_23455 [bacterium]